MRTLSAVRWRLATSQMTGNSNRLVRRASVALTAASLDTSDDQRDARLAHTALEQQALAQSHWPACSGAPDSGDAQRCWRSNSTTAIWCVCAARAIAALRRDFARHSRAGDPYTRSVWRRAL
jgi:hypothetical protein